MRLKQQYEVMETEGKFFAVPLDNAPGEFSGVIKLNSTGAAIFELLQEETDEETIIGKMSARYDVPRERLAGDIHGILEQFREKGMIV